MSPRVLALCVILSLPGLAARAETVLDETFDGPLSPAKWISHGAVVEDGRLVLRAEGVGGDYANCSLVAESPLEGMNFQRHDVAVSLSDIDLTGDAAPDARIFIVYISPDKGYEATSPGYIKLTVSDGGLVILKASSRKDGATSANDEKVLARVNATLPIETLRLQLNKDGYSLEVNDASGKQKTDHQKWGEEMDPKVWETMDPYITLRSVCRPTGAGVVEGTLGELAVESR